MSISTEPARLLGAAAALLSYGLLCLAIAGLRRRKRRDIPDVKQASDWIIAFASQTGSAEQLATRTADTLRTAGEAVRLCALAELGPSELAQAQRVLFVVSTYGEGDPPDNAARFADRVMAVAQSLGHLRYAVLALGDSDYAKFCGFGRTLDGWLRAQGAHAFFERIEVDRHSVAAIESWRQRLSHLANTSDALDWNGQPFADWRLSARCLLNPGSAGGPVYRLELEPVAAHMPEWQSGDLAQVLVPGDPDRPRDYSIASITGDGRVHLLLRLHRREDGVTGRVSGWLTEQIAVGDVVTMRVRRHPRFQLGDNAHRPLILIGNGTGIAGLRAHLKARAVDGVRPNWLIFGERNAATDFHFRDEIEAWAHSGLLERLDMVFSRDGQQHRYVQDRLRDTGAMLREWVARDAAIYVCGSLHGMAGAVDTALSELLGLATLERLGIEGRYRRDVY